MGLAAVAVLGLLGGVLPVATPPVAAADAWVVDTTTDDETLRACSDAAEDCSLRGAVANANDGGGGTIRVPAGTYVLSGGRGNDTGDLQLRAPTTVLGERRQPGVGATTVQGSGDRVFDITGRDVVLDGVHVTSGSTRGTGGGIRIGAGASATIVDATVSGNTADEGGGVDNSGTLTLRRSTVAGNTAVKKGGGVLNSGTLQIVNSTIDGNAANSGGGVTSSGSAQISFSTITRNQTVNKIGGGLYRVGGSFVVRGSIVAENDANSGQSKDCSGSPDFPALNLLGNVAGCNPTGTVPIQGAPGLGDLADNGGATRSRAPEPTSLAVDAIVPPDCPAAEGQDQTGRTRPVSDGCDLGAVEHVPFSLDLALSVNEPEIGAGAETVPTEQLLALLQSTPPVPATEVAGSTQSTILRSVILRSVILRSVILRSVILRSVILRSVPSPAVTILRSVTLEDTILRSVILRSVILRSVILRSVLLSDVELLGQATWTDLLAGTPYEDVPLQQLTLDDVKDLEAVRSLPIADIDLSSTVLGAISVPALLLGDQPMETLDGVEWCAVLPAELCGPGTSLLSASIAGAILRSVPVEDVILRSVDWATSPLGNLVIGDLPPGALATLVDCTGVSQLCADPDSTLRDIAAADLDAIIGTFGDLLLAIFGPDEIQWDQLDLGPTTRLQPVAEEPEPSHRYTATIAVRGGDGDVTLDLELPAGAEVVAGTVLVDGALAADPVRPDPAGNVVRFALPGLARGQHSVTIDAWAGLTLGAQTATATATGTSGAVTASAGPVTAASTVHEAFEATGPWGSEAAAVAELPALPDEVLHLGHLSSPGDVDYYHFTVSPEDAAAGATTSILLSNLPADYDLVLYGPGTPPLRGEPVESLLGAGDEVLDLDASDDHVVPELTAEIRQALPFETGAQLSRFSIRRGSADERIDTAPLRAGTYWIQVSGHNDASSPHPYALRRRTVLAGTGAECATRDYSLGSAEGYALPASFDGDPDALFVVDLARFDAAHDTGAVTRMLESLGTLVARDDVRGRIVWLQDDPAVREGFREWDARRCSVDAANDVVRAIGAVLDAELAAAPGVENIVLLGDDPMLPMARVPDGTALSNEASYADSFAGDHELTAALRQGQVLTDKAYATSRGVAVADHELLVPELAVGRLVETPDEIAGIMDDFVAYDGRLDPTTALVAGYDFLTDGSEQIADELAADGLAVDGSLIDPVGCGSDGAEACWTTSDLAQALDTTFGGKASGLVSLNAHFDHRRGLSSAEDRAGTVADLFSPATLASLPPSTIFSMGCHMGMNVSALTIGSPTQDWAQSLTGAGHALVANTGFGYGDTELVAYSERLMALFADELTGSTVGAALTAASQRYAADLAIVSPYDEKILHEATLYGLPMFRVGGADEGAGVATALAAQTETTGGTSGGTGPDLHRDPTPPDLAVHDADLSYGGRLDLVTTPEGSYYEVDGRSLAVQHRPIEPLDTLDLTRRDADGAPAEQARGALVTGLTSRDVRDFSARFARPVVDDGEHEPAAESLDATFPSTSPVQVVTVPGAGGPTQHLTVVPGQFRDPVDTGVGTQRLFERIRTHVYYASPGAPDPAPATITRTEAGIDEEHDAIAFDVRTEGDAVRAYVLSKAVGEDGPWLGTDLVQIAPGRWLGGRPETGTLVEYVVQVVNSGGRVSWAADKGRNHRAAEGPADARLGIDVTGPSAPVSGWFTGPVSASVTGPAGTVAIVDGSSVPDADPTVDGVQFVLTAEGVHTVVALAPDGASELAVIGIDTAPPEVAATVDAPEGFASSAVDVVLAADDGPGSGVHAITYRVGDGEPVVVAGDHARFSVAVPDPPPDGDAVTVAFSTVDVVGNRSESGSITIRFDTVAPAVSCGGAPAGWSATDVSIPCTASDGGSGVVGPATFELSTTVPAGTATADASTGAREVCDLVGNCRTAGPISGIKVDKAAPTAAIATPGDGAVVPLGQALPARYTCTDAGSGMSGGVASCTATVNGTPVADGAPLPTTTGGTYTVSLTPRDQVGNTGATVTATYRVLSYRICLLYDPDKPSPMGSAFPVKLRLCDTSGRNLSRPTIQLMGKTVDGALDPGPNFQGSSNSGYFFRYDASLAGYIYNLSTANLEVGQHTFEFTVDGVSGYQVRFTLK